MKKREKKEITMKITYELLLYPKYNPIKQAKNYNLYNFNIS